MKSEATDRNESIIYLTAPKASSYAKNRGVFMSVDTGVELQEEFDAGKRTGEFSGEKKKTALEAFFSLLGKRKKAAEEWNDYIQKELKGKVVDKDRLKEFILSGITPKEWEASFKQPGDIQERIAVQQEADAIDQEWQSFREADPEFPQEVIEKFQAEGISPDEIEVFAGEYVSVYELAFLEAFWEGVSGESFDQISSQQREEISEKLAQGDSATTVVIEYATSQATTTLTREYEEQDEVAESQKSNELEVISENETAELIDDVEAYLRETREIPDADEDQQRPEEVVLEEAREEVFVATQEDSIEEVLEKEPKPLETKVSEEQQEAIRNQWAQALGEEAYWDERGTRIVVASLSKLGVAPDQARKGDWNPTAKDVLENALIPDSEEGIHQRMQKAQQLLEIPQEQFTEQMQEALLQAHRIGTGEEGKYGGEAGIYNYDFRQLKEKMRILTTAGYSVEQANQLVTYGLAGKVVLENPELFDPSTKTDSRAQALAGYIQKRSDDGGGSVDESVLRQAYEIVQDLEKKSILDDFRTSDELRVMADEITRKAINPAVHEAKGKNLDRDQEIRRNLQHYLLETEMDLLAKEDGDGATEWLNNQFDTIFQGSASGQELDSPVLRATENKVAYAMAYLNFKYADRPEIAEKFFNAFTYRQKLMIMRVVIGQRNKESLQGAAQQLRTHGLLSSFGFEDQNVRRMFMRMGEKLEDMRLNKKIGLHEKAVTAEMVRHMQQELIEEEVSMFQSLGELSPYWNMVKDVTIDEEKDDSLAAARKRVAANAITRSTRTAYDLFVSSQREALIVARGRHPKANPQSYRSVPSGVFSYLNYEAMMWGGWDMRNVEAMKFYDAMKVDMAEEYLVKDRNVSKDALSWAEKVEYGGRLVQQLSPIPDFFSSGWRKDVMVEQLKDLMSFKYLSEPTVRGWEQRYKGITKAQIKDLLNERSIVLKSGDTKNFISAKTDATLAKELAELRKEFRGRSDQSDFVIQGKKKAKEFGLFFQLHDAGDEGAIRENSKDKDGLFARDKAAKAWDKIAASKPEEIIRLLKDRLPIRKLGQAPTAGGHDDHDHEDKPGQVHDGRHWHDELESLQKDLTSILELGDESYYNPDYTQSEEHETAFDVFRNRYGGIITTLRENAMREDIPRVVDFTNLTAHEQKIVNKAILDEHDKPIAGAAQKLMQSYQAMQKYIGEKKIYDPLAKQEVGVTRLLVQDYRFEDIYNKVYNIDDIFMDEIEEPPKITGLLKVSDKFSTDPAGDGFRRTMNDALDGMKAQDGLYKFLTQEKPEAKMEGAQEYAGALGSANGQEAIAKALRFTYGSYLDMSKPYYWMDVVGLKKLPFKMNGSEIQKIYGPEAHVFERGEILKIIDRDLRFMLASSAGKKELADQIKFERGEISAEEVALRKENYLHHNEEMLHSLKERVGVTKGDEVKTLALQMTLFLIVAMLGAALVAASEVAISESTGGSGGGGGGGGGGGHH